MWLICWLGHHLGMFSGRQLRSLMLKNLVGVCDRNLGQPELSAGSELSSSSKHAPNTKRLINLRANKKTLEVEQRTFLNQRTPEWDRTGVKLPLTNLFLPSVFFLSDLLSLQKPFKFPGCKQTPWSTVRSQEKSFPFHHIWGCVLAACSQVFFCLDGPADLSFSSVNLPKPFWTRYFPTLKTTCGKFHRQFTHCMETFFLSACFEPAIW